MQLVLFLIVRINKDVVQVDNTAVIQKVGECTVDVVLEGGWCVSQAKGHHIVLKVTISCVEHCFPVVFLVNVDAVVGIPKVHFGKDLGTCQVIQHFTHQWQGVSVLECDAVQALVIHTQVQATILLGHKHDWHPCWTL